jgi:uncharacterized protein YjbI with pentapeptide repeats
MHFSSCRGTDLSKADLREAYLTSAILSGAVLSGTNLGWANLSGATLGDAILSGVDLSGALLSDVDFSKAILKDLMFEELTNWPAGFDPPAHKAAETSAAPTPEISSENVTIAFHSDLSPQQRKSALEIFADFFRECGGRDFESRVFSRGSARIERALGT